MVEIDIVHLPTDQFGEQFRIWRIDEHHCFKTAFFGLKNRVTGYVGFEKLKYMPLFVMDGVFQRSGDM